jgi:hypothetical protein
MKTLKLSLLSVLESLEFGWQAIRYALIFVSGNVLSFGFQVRECPF